MPLSINVGLSRKRSENYQSEGVSINVTAELDQSLLARPDELQRQIASLYSQAERALCRRPDLDSPPAANPHGPSRSNGNGGGRNGNGHRSNGRTGGGPATDSQRRAINAIASRQGIDPHLEAREIIGSDLAELSIRQASELIDHLKANGKEDRHQ
jgi:hypothetical protein